MRKKSSKPLFVALASALLMIYLVTGAIAQSNNIKTILPEEKLDASATIPLVVGQLLPPPEDYKWEQGENIVKIAQQAKSAVAYLDSKEFGTPQVHFINTDPKFSADEKSYTIISVVKYEEGSNSTMVTLSQASPATCQSGVVFGSQTISLDNGEQAFLWEDSNLSYPRSLAIVRKDKIITIATWADKEELIKMAKKVVQIDQ